jgi:Transposase DNA-binding/Transposase DDE domain
VRAPDVVDEFSSISLGDERLNRRALALAARASAAPAASFPKMVTSVSEREAMYRFMENDRVGWEAIVAPHQEATVQRCREARTVVVPQDTTFFTFDGDREGLGPIAGNKRGFGGHFSIAVSADRTRAPLGVIALFPFVREDRPKLRTKAERSARTLETRALPRDSKESARWWNAVCEVESRLGREVSCIHVMDQEADDYALLASLVEGHRFVVRGSAERRLERRGARVSDALDEVTASAFRTVPLTERTKPSANHSARRERNATLEVRATSVEIVKPQHAQHHAKQIRLNIVQVFEPSPPPNADPIEWTLYTTEPIDTSEDLVAVVDHYRARWRIEEYFKALKTGCAYEKRQLVTYAALLRALALLAPIAWRLLAIRTLARDGGDAAASVVVDEVQLEVLRHLTPNYRIPARPTVRDVLLAIADIGGHIRQNGEPGWLVLGRGFEDFVKAEAVWRAARRPRSDQS